MRQGVNPIRNDAFMTPPPIVAAVITHLPNRVGYHAARMPIIHACIESIRRHAGRDLPLLVWDNGSDDCFRNYLIHQARPDYLMLTPNIGKPAARAAIFGAFPPETVIAICDDDILHFPGWLDAQLALLEGFPNVGMVSAWANRFSFGWGIDATLAYAREHGRVEEGRFIPDHEEAEYAVSVGMDPQSWVRQSAGQQDYRITCHGMSAYAQAQHCQFIGYAGRLRGIAAVPRAPRRAEKDFDCDVDAAGLLRLTTTQRYTFHMGNVLDAQLKGTLKGMGLL